MYVVNQNIMTYERQKNSIMQSLSNLFGSQGSTKRLENIKAEVKKIRESQPNDGQDEWYLQFLADMQILRLDEELMSFEAYRILVKAYSSRPVHQYVDDVLSKVSIESLKLVETYMTVIIQNHSSQQIPKRVMYPDYDKPVYRVFN